MLPNHAPLDDRRAVRHAGHPAPGPDRPRSRRAPGLRPEHHARAAPRRRLGRPVPAGRPGAAGVPRRRDPRARRRRDARAGHERARSTSWARRCSGPQLAAALGLPYAFASHFAPAAPAGRGRGCTAASSARRRSWSSRTSSPGSTSSPPTPPPRRSGSTSPPSAAGSNALFGRGRTFTDEEADAVLASPAGQHVRADGHLLRGRHAGRGEGLPRRLRQARRRRRADRRPPVADRRSQRCARWSCWPTRSIAA